VAGEVSLVKFSPKTIRPFGTSAPGLALEAAGWPREQAERTTPELDRAQAEGWRVVDLTAMRVRLTLVGVEASMGALTPVRLPSIATISIPARTTDYRTGAVSTVRSPMELGVMIAMCALEETAA
jgi:hypothetical protein